MSRESSFPPKSILIVDEDLNLRRSLALMLKREGYLVETSDKACDALDLLRQGNYNLVIMDITTPENRLTFLPAVLCMYPHISVLVFSAHWSPETALELGKLGVHSHLEKPINPDQLLAALDKILSK